jgi:hypothetical protein
MILILENKSIERFKQTHPSVPHHATQIVASIVMRLILIETVEAL